MKKIVFAYMAAAAIMFAAIAYAEETEETVSLFDQKWAVSASSNNNMGIFSQYTDLYISNRPWEIGLGLRYKKLSAQLAMPIASKKFSVDFAFNFYFEKTFYEAYFKYYDDLYVMNSDKNSGLDILSSGMMATYVFNYENHSLSSVINLDKKQSESSGSMLYGFGVFYTSIHSTTETMNHYTERQRLLYTGPSIGYSYIWVFENGLFLNVSFLFLSNFGLNITMNEWLTIPQIEPRVVFGNHKKRWSFNIKLMNNSAIIVWDDKDYDMLTLLTFSTMFSVRF